MTTVERPLYRLYPRQQEAMKLMGSAVRRVDESMFESAVQMALQKYALWASR